MTQKTHGTDNEFFIDITNEICPMTFVKTKLFIEKKNIGDVVEVRLKGKEPLHNVPRSATDHGHTVLSVEPEGADPSGDEVHRIFIRKEV